MNDDISQYDCYYFNDLTKELEPAPLIESTANYNHYTHQLHHFVEKTIRKNSPSDYARFEFMQKLILMPKQMNYDLSSPISEERFLVKWGVKKYDFIFNKKKWLEGYYD